MNITQFRQQNPEYNDMSDLALARALHGKNYSDMPFATFAEKFGVESVGSEATPSDELERFAREDAQARMLQSGELKPVEPGFVENLKKNWPQYAGGIAGGLAGAATLGPDPTDLITVPAVKKRTAQFLGGLAGATVGGMGGKGLEQTYRYAKTGQIGTFKEIYGQQAVAGLEEFAGELTGRGLGAVAGKAMNTAVKPLAKRFLPIATKTAKELRKVGAHATLAQLTDSRTLDIMEAIAEGSFLGGGTLQKIHLKEQPKAAKAMFQNVLDSYAGGLGKQLDPTSIGKLIGDSVSGNDAAFRSAQKAMYKHVDKLVKKGGNPSVVDLRPLKRFAQSNAKNRFKVASSQMGDSLLERLQAVPDFATFQQAASIRTSLMKATQAASRSADVAAGLSKQSTKITHAAIESAGSKLPSDVLPAWKAARKFTATNLETFNSDLVYKLTKTLGEHPEKAVKVIVSNEGLTSIGIAKKAIGPKNWPAVKYGVMADLLQKSTSKSKAAFNIPAGHVLKKNIQALGPEVMNQLYTKAEQQALMDAADVLIRIQKPTQEFAGTGRMVISLMQAGALSASAWTRSPKATAGILAGPYVLGRFMASPKWSKVLTQSFDSPRLSPAVAARLLNAARGYGVEYARSYGKGKRDDIRSQDVLSRRMGP